MLQTVPALFHPSQLFDIKTVDIDAFIRRGRHETESIRTEPSTADTSSMLYRIPFFQLTVFVERENRRRSPVSLFIFGEYTSGVIFRRCYYAATIRTAVYRMYYLCMRYLPLLLIFVLFIENEYTSFISVFDDQVDAAREKKSSGTSIRFTGWNTAFFGPLIVFVKRYTQSACWIQSLSSNTPAALRVSTLAFIQ